MTQAETPMTPDRAREILTAYGAEPARWPEAECEALQAWLDANPGEAEQARTDEADLDAWLDHAVMEPGDLLQARIMRDFRTSVRSGVEPDDGAAPDEISSPVRSRRMIVPRARVFDWRAPVAAACVLAVGLAAGWTSGALTGTDTLDETLYADAFYGLDEDWTDWLVELDT
ncbi:hypothetical protein RMQ97_09555 [Maricaulis sp. D1M11]|uniref:hypothetical protein n=1 Tax=Maricaulis sp. D1M11 TaxID=3076117 RepID=UPI0039B64C60